MTTRTIKIAAYTDPAGVPVCARDFKQGHVCKFLRARHFGTVEICGVTGLDVYRDDGKGWIRPSDGCIVWGADSAEVAE